MKKFRLILIIVVLLSLLAANGWWLFSANSASGNGGSNFAKLLQSTPPAASFIEVKNLVITLQGEGGRERYMLLDLVLVVHGEEQSSKAEAFLPAVRGATVALLNNQPYSEVRARPIMELHDQLMKRYHQESSQLGFAPLPFDDVMISKMVFQ